MIGIALFILLSALLGIMALIAAALIAIKHAASGLDLTPAEEETDGTDGD